MTRTLKVRPKVWHRTGNGWFMITAALLVTIMPRLVMPRLALAADPVRLPLHDAIAAAWNNDPVRQELAVNAQSADARAEAAHSWFAGGPVLNASYYDDRAAGTNLHYTTWQGGVSVPLWLPGQGTATQRVAAADAQTARARIDVQRMAVAVRLLEQTGAELLAERRIVAARTVTASLSRITVATAHSRARGESTGVELQAASAQLADARGEIAMAQLEVTAARTALATLMGRPGVPDLLVADPRWLSRLHLSDLHVIALRDPRVQAARREVQAAEQQVRLAQASFMPNPEVGLDAIDQGQFGSPWATQIGVNVRVPLPSAVTRTPLIASAQNRLAAANRAEAEAQRAVHNELAQVIAQLGSARDVLGQARISASQSLRRAEAMERSWRVGETPLIEALRARTDAYRALLALNRAEIAQASAVVRIGIATGNMP